MTREAIVRIEPGHSQVGSHGETDDKGRMVWTWGQQPVLVAEGVEVTVYPSTTEPDHVSVQIDTDQQVLVMLNDGDVFRGDPEHIQPLVGGPMQTVLYAAFGLLGDGAGEEWGLNSEYTRAIVELVKDTCGLGSEAHEDVLAFIRKINEERA